MSKQFGLIKPDKSKKKQAAIANVFGDSSSDDDNAPKKKPRVATEVGMTQKKLAKKLQEEALAEDPNIFQYDEVFDEMENKRKEEKLAKKTASAKEPKYIKKLLETAEKRKLENERRVERQVQKEREAEGEEFKDKESFVTSSYRKKLEEMKEAEEAEKREAYLENIGDVTKQQDMSGFYRHIYEQKMDGGKSKDEKIEEKTEEKGENSEKKGENSEKKEEKSMKIEEKSMKIEEKSVKIEEKPVDKKKNYRKRKTSADEKQGESDKDENNPENPEKETEKAHLPCNLDADSDFEIDSSDSEDEKVKKPEEIKKEETETPKELPQNGKVEETPEIKLEDIPVPPPKPKIDIWKKRTVGEAFDEAVQKYYQRKAEREAAA